MSVIEKFEFFETPDPFSEFLFDEVNIAGRVCEPCVGSGAIIRASDRHSTHLQRQWVTNDLCPAFSSDWNLDATKGELFKHLDDAGPVDWFVSNPPFTPAIDIVDYCLHHARVGVAMHLRISINEPLKRGPRQTWFAEHPPTGILFLPRFAYQRSAKSGKWSTDSVTSAWHIWRKDNTAQYVRYAPPCVVQQTTRYAKTHRSRMDQLLASLRTSDF